MINHVPFVKLPKRWLGKDSPALYDLKAVTPALSTNLAALMVLMPIAHHVGIAQLTGDDQAIATVALTYDQLCRATGLSRTLISNGLAKLVDMGLVDRTKTGRINVFQLIGAGERDGYAKLPAKSLYSQHGTRITAFKDFTLRNKIELHALKLYYLFAADRDFNTNSARIGYERAAVRTGVPTNDITSALSLLLLKRLIQITDEPRPDGNGVIQSYRLIGLDSRLHRGTVARSSS